MTDGQAVRADWPTDLPSEVFLLAVDEAPSLATDPAGYLAAALVRAKVWIPAQEDILKVYAALKIATGYEDNAMANFTRPGRLDAQEIRRRAEHRLGQMIIDGQEAGIFRRQSDGNRSPKLALKEFLGVSDHGEVNALRNPGRPSVEDFEAALELARAEGNLTRAAVTRIIKAEELTSERDPWNYGRRIIDSNKIVSALADQMEAAISGLDLVDRKALDPVRTEESKQTVRNAIAVIQKEMRKW